MKKLRTNLAKTIALSLLPTIACLCEGLFAAEEGCPACKYPVKVQGDFSHRRLNRMIRIEGADEDPEAFREEIAGRAFTISITNLPAGRYIITIGLAETFYREPNERVFDVRFGTTTLISDFDIVAAAGGPRRACTITGDLEHPGDAHGPLTIAFEARKGEAKFNTCQVRNEAGEVVLAFRASDLADVFTAAARQAPQVDEPPIWRDPSRPLQERINDLIRRMSLAEKVEQLQNDAPAIPRLSLPAYNYWNEALHGVAGNGIATVFPQAIALAATWNPDLLYRVATAIGIEGRAKFNDYASKNDGNSRWFTGLTFWSPNINIFRDPRWGRGQETYGEDPFLTGVMAVAFIRGLQGDDPQYMMAMACAKHYAVHSGPEPLRHRFDVAPSERDLYETYLPHFEMAVREGRVGGVMGAYNSVYGVPCCASSFLLGDILRKQWGFEGYIVSDCGAINDIWNARAHRYVETPEEAAAVAVKAGCNLCCGSDYNALVRAVQKGLISESQIDQALYYTLWTRFRLGLFDPPDKCPFWKIGIEHNDTPEHRQLALEAARQSIVLLKNSGILPLNRSKIKKIAVFGENATDRRMLWGNYNGTPSRCTTILEGIRELAGSAMDVNYAQGCPLVIRPAGAMMRFPGRPAAQPATPPRPASELLEEAVRIAADADVLIYVGGINSQLEGEEGNVRASFGVEGFSNGDRTRIELPKVQQDFIKAIYATGKPVILINCSGSAMAIPWEAERLPAIIQAWYPGEEGGRAVGEILFGQVNPSGRLPITFYSSTEDLPDFNDYSMKNRTYRYFEGKPLYAFGHGLSYTKFAYTNGRLAAKKVPADGTIKVSLTVRNSGKRDGDEVVQVYFRHVKPSLPQPKLALCGFARVHLKRGQSQKVTIDIPAQRLRYWDPDKKQYVVDPGEYEILVGAASDDIRLRLPLTIVKGK
ncbi:MAG: glycoside hydrolase family 3 C-terminal domain-containing protein [Sedimentisphaerales bacterium]|nr:glycoside hydrolase family 3 C-terminal domain-containing protein [Sedimentisphaerales bacterium]